MLNSRLLTSSCGKNRVLEHIFPATTIEKDRVTVLSFALLIVTLTLATRPYFGIIHDSRFYTVQTLSAFLPGRFSDDLYFQYGSQDQFTLFTVLYKPLLAAFGVAKSAMIATIIGLCFLVASLFYLSIKMFRDPQIAFTAVAAAVTLPGGVMFVYGEQFVTPRLFAESITLCALGTMLDNRKILALVLLIFSVTIHPIMTLPGIAVFFLHEAAGKRVWWLVGVFAIMASIGMAAWGVQPFVRLLEVFDPAWLAIVRVRDFFCFLTEWALLDWLKLGNIFILAAIALGVSRPPEQKFLTAVILAAIGGLALNFLGGDILKNVLIIDAQQYRATWILSICANLFSAVFLMRLDWRITSSLTRVALPFAACMLIMTTFNGAGYYAVTPTLFMMAPVVLWEQKRKRPVPFIIRGLGLIVVGGVLGIALQFFYYYLKINSASLGQFWQGSERVALVGTTFGVIAANIVISHGPPRPITRRLTLLASIGLIVATATTWDQRTPWDKFIETTDVAPTSLTSLLPDQKPIYWEGDVRVPWFVLKRASYFSCAQGTGALFFRGTAISYQHRFDSFKLLRTADFGQETSCPPVSGGDNVQVGHNSLAAVCRNEPDLGAIVLTSPVTGAAGRVWVSPVKFEDIRSVLGQRRVFTTDKFYIYSCDDFR